MGSALAPEATSSSTSPKAIFIKAGTLLWTSKNGAGRDA